MDIQKIYEEVAKKYGVTAEEVKREMQMALEAAWENPRNTEEVKRKQQEITPNGEIPTPEQVITHCIDCLKEDL